MSAANKDKDNLVKELQANVNYLENIIALLPGHVYWVNRDNIYLGCNNLQAECLKLQAPRDIIGKRTHDFVREEIAQSLDDANNRIMRTGIAQILEEPAIWEDEPDGEQKIYLSQKVPVRNAAEKIVGLLGVSFDISDRKRMEQELQEAKIKAEIANQAKTDFLRNMEHDIRTPLSGIFSVASHLASLEQEPQKKELLEDLEHAAEQLIGYLNTIVEVSHVNKGVVPVILKEFNLEDAVQSMFLLELPAAKNKNLQLSLNFQENVPKKIIGDSFRIYRILLNLVSNAIKFTRHGFVKITVQLVEQSSDYAVIRFCVEDSGIGIKTKDRELIYEKFSCGTLETGRANSGMGLGLWIVKQFIQDIGGEIALDSEVNKGSRFSCTIRCQLP